MAENTRIRGLLEWGLAAFHTAFLFAGLLALLYAGGNLGALLASLNTLLGLGLFGVLWFFTWWSTRRAARGIDLTALERTSVLARRLGRVVLWGGVNGALFFAVLLALIVINASAAIVQGHAFAGDFLPVIAFGGVAGSAAAFIIGAIAALLFALVDGALLTLARWLVPET
jgi:hypothetical protein